MALVARKLEGRDVVIEPPAEAGILRVAEIHAGVVIAVEAICRERLGLALVFEGPKRHLDRFLGDGLSVEPRKEASRAAAVETTPVVEDAETHGAHINTAPARALSCSSTALERAGPISCTR